MIKAVLDNETLRFLMSIERGRIAIQVAQEILRPFWGKT